MSTTHPQPEDIASAPQSQSARRRWPLALVLLFCCLVIIHQRNRIRAYWWSSCLVRTDDLGARGYYLASLAAVGDKAAGAIERLSRNEDPEVRALAIYPLKSLPAEAAMETLHRLLNDSDRDVRESAAVALVFMSSAGARAVLRETAASEEPGAAEAVSALGRSQDAADLEALCQALARHPSPAVRAQAAESLAARLMEETVRGESEAPAVAPHGCDAFLALVQSLADDATFSGLLSLEREIAAAAGFAQRQGRSAFAADRAPGPAPPPRRTVADVAAKGLSSLTGRALVPRKDRSAVQQATLAAWCRRIYRQRRLRPGGSGENPPTTLPGSSDTPTVQPPEAVDGSPRD